MIAALIAASAAKPNVEVVKSLPGVRELVPFDFELGGDAGEEGMTTISGVQVKTAGKKSLPTPKGATSVNGTTSKKGKSPKMPTPKGSSSDLVEEDPRVRANKVCAPQKAKLTPEQQAAILAQGSTNGAASGKGAKVGKVATVNDRWANSSFQNAPAPDELPMPAFLKDLPKAPSTPEPPLRAISAPARAASAAGLKSLLGVQDVPAAPSPARVTSGPALFQNIISSAGGAPPPHAPMSMVPPMPPMPHPMAHPMAHSMPPMPPMPPMPQYGAPPPQYAQPPAQAPVQQKLNALFGFPAQPYPAQPPYPTTPESPGGDFQKLMSKLNTGRA
jgi:hypothetical protein